MRSATPTSPATFDARTGCSLLGTMKRTTDSIHAASRSSGLANFAFTGLRAERTRITRSKPQATTACSSRLASPRLSASGSRPWSCRLHDGQRLHAAGAQPSGQSRANLKARAPTARVRGRGTAAAGRRRRWPCGPKSAAIARSAGPGSGRFPRRATRREWARAPARGYGMPVAAGQSPQQLRSQRTGRARDQQRAESVGSNGQYRTVGGLQGL